MGWKQRFVGYLSAIVTAHRARENAKSRVTKLLTLYNDQPETPEGKLARRRAHQIAKKYEIKIGVKSDPHS
jgi:hypothetical protein